MRKTSKATITTAVSNRRAAKSAELMFYRLEQFANLTDDVKTHEAFAHQYSDFLPVIFFDSGMKKRPKDFPVGWRLEFQEIFRVFRDLLRDVWKHGDNAKLAVLMGTAEREWQIINRQSEPRTLDRILSGYETDLREAITRIPTRYFAVPARVYPDWNVGTFRYEADTKFRKAVYELFRQSWRAKVCPQCGKYFIAGKPAQLYCSSKCYGSAKRERDLEFWRSVGTNRRKERKAKERRS